MGKRKILIWGVSGTGKSSVCQELRRRGYVAIDGMRELASKETNDWRETEGFGHETSYLGLRKRKEVGQQFRTTKPLSSVRFEKFQQFLDFLMRIFILDVDAETLNERLDNRPDDDWGSARASGNSSSVYTPQKKTYPVSGFVLDATQPLVSVVDAHLSHVRASA